MQVGLVGAGPWARLFTAPLIEETDGLDLAGVWARRPEAAAELGKPVFGSFDEVLESCDAVAFAVPPDVQAELATRAAAAGKHVLLDKPVARDAQAARALADAVQQSGVASQVLLTNRYMAANRQFLAELQGADVLHVSCAFITAAVLEGSAFATPWRVAEPHGLLDLGPHAFDLVVAVAGPVQDVIASNRGGVLSARLTHESGSVSDVTLSASTPGPSRPMSVDVVTASGVARLPERGMEEALAARRVAGEEFAAACRGDLQQPIDAQHGLALQILLDRVSQAIT